MSEIKVEQIRNFRLHSHHLDKKYQREDIAELVGACGMQNTPPGAWETSLYNRVPDCSMSEMEHLLYREKLILQAWSLRGAPYIFPRLIISKSTLDRTLAEWMLPLLPIEKQELWNKPSMYENPDQQTVGGAVVSFMLRPCAFKGMVVFGERNGISPTFTSYQNWTGNSLKVSEGASKRLVRKFLHCYGPTTVDRFVSWLGCSSKQGKRMWKTISEEMEPVRVLGKTTYILSVDREQLFSPASRESFFF